MIILSFFIIGKSKSQSVSFDDLEFLLNSNRYQKELLLAMKHWSGSDSTKITANTFEFTYISKDRAEIIYAGGFFYGKSDKKYNKLTYMTKTDRYVINFLSQMKDKNLRQKSSSKDDNSTTYLMTNDIYDVQLTISNKTNDYHTILLVNKTSQ